ncbi:MAG: leucyl aminopeptidase family protein [Planctomycetota bacterium]|jgi:leucyl aminopeptidase
MFKSIRVRTSKAAVDVVAVCAGGKLPATRPGLGAAERRALEAARKRPGFKADAGELGDAGDGALLLGVGKKADLDADTLRKAGARLARQLDRRGTTAVRLDLRAAKADDMDAENVGRAVAEGMGLANWRVDSFDGSATRNEPARGTLAVSSPDRATRDGLALGLTLAECTNYARKLAATPPNVCHPQWMATEARRLARSTGMTCRVITYQQAVKLGMGGLVNVGRASARKPCLIILEHRPKRVAAAARGEKLVLVGKTITYDTGGYSLKISNSMKGMKYDKCGGMAVLGAMRAIATLKLPVAVAGVLPTAENMVGGDAYRPDDIITMYNGVSVEVTNTDAEGRLVLADALAWSCKKLAPTAIVDAATLTGGVIVALGAWCAGMFCNDDGLRKRLDGAADRSGERLWRLPLWDEHRDFMRAKHADVWNSGPKRDGHAIQGAAFLSYFVENDVPWAHLDIAGMASVDGDGDLNVQGPTGYGVRLLTELARGYTRK